VKLALECRTDMLEMVQPFADFDFPLAHKVLEDETYATYFKESDRVKFLDNSVNELGSPLSIEKVVEAYDKVMGTYLVSPDYIGDADKTVEAYLELTKKCPEHRIVGVVQGSNFQDAFRCLGIYGNSGVVAIPYDLCSEREDPPWLMGLRRALFISNIPYVEGKSIHLLGFTSLEEFFWYRGNPMVTSIDTGIPVLLGLLGLDILDPLESKDKATFLQMEKIELTQKGWTGIIRNIALLRKYLV